MRFQIATQEVIVMNKSEVELVSDTVEFLDSIGYAINVEDTQQQSPVNTAWTYSHPFVEV